MINIKTDREIKTEDYIILGRDITSLLKEKGYKIIGINFISNQFDILKDGI